MHCTILHLGVPRTRSGSYQTAREPVKAPRDPYRPLQRPPAGQTPRGFPEGGGTRWAKQMKAKALPRTPRVCLLPLPTQYLPRSRGRAGAFCPGSHVTGSSNLSDLLQKALKELSAAMKAIAFYPSHHPSVVSTLERLVLTLREALAMQDSIQIGVAEAAFLFAGKPIAEEDRMLAGFAAYLSRRGIGALVFRTPLEGESLKGLLEVLTLDPGTLQARGGPARCLQERRLGGVSIEEFDAAAARRTARTDTAAGPSAGGAQRAGTSCSDLLARVLAGRSDQR